MTRARAWLQLLRVPNLFTAAADVVAGAMLAGIEWNQPVRLVALIVASMSFYAAGVVFNDVFDAARDAQERAGRPIPSGMISRRWASTAGGVLLAVSIGLCWALGGNAVWVGLLLAACVLSYDGPLKRTVLGPSAMGMCRALNLLLGMSAVGWPPSKQSVFCVVLVWIYVSSLTVFARTEWRDSARPRLISGTAGMILAVGGLVGLVPYVDGIRLSYLVMVGLLVGELAVCSRRALDSGAPEDVQHAVGRFVLMLVLIDATIVLAIRGPLHSAAVAVWMIPSIVLSRRIRVT